MLASTGHGGQLSDIFISYAHEDRAHAERLAHALEAEGWSVWWDHIIPTGRIFADVIDEQLEAARCVIVMWSPISVGRNWVKTEAQTGLDRGILVPVLIDVVARFPLAFRQLQAANLVGWDGAHTDPAFQAMVRDMARILGPSPRLVTMGDLSGRLAAQDLAAPAMSAPQPESVPESSAASLEPPAVITPPRTTSLDRLRTSILHAYGAVVQAPIPVDARLISSRTGLCIVLAALLVVNWIETMGDNWIGMHWGRMVEWRHQTAHAMLWLEGHLSFAGHAATNVGAIYGYTAVYFFLFPALLLTIAVALTRRPTLAPFRLFVTATVIDYLVSLPFYAILPAPERWSVAESGAVMLSDRWTSNLISSIRPISGLDNCFPSFHTSLTVVAVLTAFVCGLRYRWSALALGTTVVCSTFVLGIHWLPDIVGGVAAGVLSTAIALRFEPRWRALQAMMARPTPSQPAPGAA